MSVALPAVAQAQDLRSEVSDRDATIAAREAQRTWDNIKSFGAETIADRSRRPFQPDGLRLGNFNLYPSAATTVTFDDNIFGSNAARKSDVITQIGTGLIVASDLPRHAFDFAFSGRFNRYAEHDSFDNAEASASLNSTIHVNSAHSIGIALSTAYGQVAQLSPEQPTTPSEPIPFWRNTAAISFKRDAGRLWASVGAGVDSIRYTDGTALDGSRINASAQDLDTVSASTIVGYRFSPGYSLQAKLKGLRQTTPGSSQLDRDARGYDAALGITAEINPLLRWELFGGWASREFDHTWAPVNAAVALARITWLPTQLATINLTAERKIGDTSAQANASAFIDNRLTVQLDYELLRNLVFTVQGQYRDLEFTGIDRRDHVYVAQTGLQYLHTKNWVFSANYEHQLRDSTLSEASLTRNRIWLGAKLQF